MSKLETDLAGDLQCWSDMVAEDVHQMVEVTKELEEENVCLMTTDTGKDEELPSLPWTDHPEEWKAKDDVTGGSSISNQSSEPV